MGQRINNVKAFLQQQIRALSAKQDESIAVQAEMKAQLGSVAQDVEHTRGEVSQARVFAGTLSVTCSCRQRGCPWLGLLLIVSSVLHPTGFS